MVGEPADIDLNHLNGAVKDEELEVVEGGAAAVADEFFDDDARLDVLIDLLALFFVIAALQPVLAQGDERGAVQRGLVRDELHPARGMRWLDNEAVGKVVKRDGVGAGGETIEPWQDVRAKA